MALEHAILLALAEKAGSGYDLARRFDKSIGYFWTATHQQIYKVLGRMEADGWVAATHVAQDGRPDKKVYEPTAEGRAQLANWVAVPAAPDAVRSELGLKLRAASFGDKRAVVADVKRHRQLRVERLAAYLENEKREFPDPSRLRGHRLHQWLVLRGGITLERGLLDWYDDVLTALDPKGTR